MSEKSDALKYAWWVEDEKVALVYADTTNTEDSYSSPSVVKTVTISGRFLPDAFVSGDTGGTNETGMTEECSLPKEFHDAIVNKAIQKGYESEPEKISLAPYFEKQYEKSVMEAKRKRNQGGISGAVVQLRDY